MREIEVEFPEGPRMVEAEIQLFAVSRFGADPTDMPTINNTVPVNMPGWIFKQMVGGKWVAYRTTR